MLTNLDRLKAPKSKSQVAAWISTDLKTWLQAYCESNQIKLGSLIAAMLADFKMEEESK